METLLAFIMGTAFKHEPTSIASISVMWSRDKYGLRIKSWNEMKIMMELMRWLKCLAACGITIQSYICFRSMIDSAHDGSLSLWNKWQIIVIWIICHFWSTILKCIHRLKIIRNGNVNTFIKGHNHYLKRCVELDLSMLMNKKKLDSSTLSHVSKHSGGTQVLVANPLAFGWNICE